MLSNKKMDRTAEVNAEVGGSGLSGASMQNHNSTQIHTKLNNKWLSYKCTIEPGVTGEPKIENENLWQINVWSFLFSTEDYVK